MYPFIMKVNGTLIALFLELYIICTLIASTNKILPLVELMVFGRIANMYIICVLLALSYKPQIVIFNN